MRKQTITFRTDARSKSALDAIAASLDREVDYVLNEAISDYIEVHQRQIAHITEGIRQADAGEFAKDSEVTAAFAR